MNGVGLGEEGEERSGKRGRGERRGEERSGETGGEGRKKEREEEGTICRGVKGVE